MHALHHCSLLQLRLWYTADTCRASVVHVFGLDAPHAAELLVAVPATDVSERCPIGSASATSFELTFSTLRSGCSEWSARNRGEGVRKMTGDTHFASAYPSFNSQSYSGFEIASRL